MGLLNSKCEELPLAGWQAGVAIDRAIDRNHNIYLRHIKTHWKANIIYFILANRLRQSVIFYTQVPMQKNTA
jgi:hypothetical protein